MQDGKQIVLTLAADSPSSKRKHEKLGYLKAHMAKQEHCLQSRNGRTTSGMCYHAAKANAKTCATHTLSLTTHACHCSKFKLHSIGDHNWSIRLTQMRNC